MSSLYKKILFLLCAILIFLFIQFSGVNLYINFQTIKENRELLLVFVHRHYIISVLLFIFTYFAVAALSIPIAAPMTILGGFLFGVIPGAFYTNIGATLGATGTFLLFRYVLGESFQRKYSEKLKPFNYNLEMYGPQYLLTVRFIAAIPFFLVNILASFTKIPTITFMWTTSLGIIPGSIVFAYAGKQLGSINSVNEIFSFKIIIAFVLLIALGFSSILFKKLQQNRNV